MLYGSPFERGEDVVLIRSHKLVGGRDNIIIVPYGNLVVWIFVGHINFGDKTVSKLPTALPAMVVETIGRVTLKEQVGVEVGSCLEGTTEAITFYKVL